MHDRRALTVCFALLCGLASAAGAPPANLSDYDLAVRAALKLELDGRDADRNALLQQVLDEDPDHPAARWHLGFIRHSDEWLPHERVLHADDRAAELDAYRQSRIQRGDTIEDHRTLAHGARERGLLDEERAHLNRILELDVNHAEARQRLGHRRVDGFWVAPEDVARARRVFGETRRDLERWRPVVDRFAAQTRRTPVARHAAREQLSAIHDPAAIPAVERALDFRSEQESLWHLDWLSGLTAWEAGVALARQAVFSPHTAVRVRAGELLRRRRLEECVPALLAALPANPQFSSDLQTTHNGWLLLTMAAFVETQFDERELVQSIVMGPEILSVSLLSSGPGRPIGPDYRQDPARRQTAERLLSDRRRRAELDAAAWTAQLDELSGRLRRCLSNLVQGTDDFTPHDWWQWWHDYNEVYVSGRKPLLTTRYEESWYVDDRGEAAPTQARLAIGSCFAAGTPVVTERGRCAIEEVRLGDRVLAQDVDSGELAFKPVFKATVRPEARLLRISTAHGDLVCTAGHPFWVNGQGWRKARELGPGQRFHSATGSSEVFSIEDAGRSEKTYNLVVADFHTYFVGDGRILSHDNTPRNPTNSIVPGLERDFTIAAAP
jgi:hypothetical protein